ncbi:MAG: hypothetical protein ACLURP_08065 [Ruminococcus sp.]
MKNKKAKLLSILLSLGPCWEPAPVYGEGFRQISPDNSGRIR